MMLCLVTSYLCPVCVWFGLSKTLLEPGPLVGTFEVCTAESPHCIWKKMK